MLARFAVLFHHPHGVVPAALRFRFSGSFFGLDDGQVEGFFNDFPVAVFEMELLVGDKKWFAGSLARIGFLNLHGHKAEVIRYLDVVQVDEHFSAVMEFGNELRFRHAFCFLRLILEVKGLVKSYFYVIIYK